MTLDEALAWCFQHRAVIRFLDVYGTPRVKVATGGYPLLAERDTFQEAIEDAEAALERLRALVQQPEARHCGCSDQALPER